MRVKPDAWWTGLVILACTLIGADLLFQPTRFSRTPAYGNLIQVFSAPTWGVLYLAVAAGFVSWMVRRKPGWWGAAVHTAAVMLIGGWLFAFIVRWRSDDSTTAVNVVSWSIYLLMTIRSSIENDGTAPRPPTATAHGDDAADPPR